MSFADSFLIIVNELREVVSMAHALEDRVKELETNKETLEEEIEAATKTIEQLQDIILKFMNE